MGGKRFGQGTFRSFSFVCGTKLQIDTVLCHGRLRNGDLLMLHPGSGHKQGPRCNRVDVTLGTQRSVPIRNIVNLIAVFAVTVHRHQKRKLLQADADDGKLHIFYCER